MTLSRRNFMLTTAGSFLLAAGGSMGVFLATRTPKAAIEPWRLAGSAYSEPRERALSYALLAPNPHNRQPWLADLGTPNEVKLLVDTERLLKETDPFDRQITIGLGCFIELMVQAAAADGYRVDVALFPDGVNEKALDQRPICVAKFSQDNSLDPDPLFQWIHKRRSVKDPFETDRPVAQGVLTTLKGVLIDSDRPVNFGATNNEDEVAVLRELSWNAFQVEYRTPAKLQESIDLMRMGKSEIDAAPDGLDIGGPFLETLMLAGILSRDSLSDPRSSGYQQGLTMYKPICETAMAYVWLTTAGNSRLEQIETGRAWVRVNLAATGVGIGLHPMSQALQEYGEMKPNYNKAHELLAKEGERIQMLGRLGYCKMPPPSPRWALEHKLLKA